MQSFESYEKLPEAEGYIGDGSFGHVKKVRRKRDSKILACKTIRFDGTNPSKTAVVERECKILKQLNHPNIVQQFEIQLGPNKAKIYMEYCEGGSLQDLINDRKKKETLLSEEYVWTIAYQLASALLYCHLGLRFDKEGFVSFDGKNNQDWKTILHRDIKPANVFMMNRSETALDSIKLGDFGLGYVLHNDDNPGTYVGTAQYLAPEISRLSAHPIHWTTDCDMFSFGCTLYVLCKLTPPFANHLEAEFESYSPISDIYTSQLRDLIASCLSFLPDARPQNALHLFQQCQCQVLRPHDDTPPGAPSTRVAPLEDEVLSTAIEEHDADLTRKAFKPPDRQSNRTKFVRKGHPPSTRRERRSVLVTLPTHWDEAKQESAQPQVQDARTNQKGAKNPKLLSLTNLERMNPLLPYFEDSQQIIEANPEDSHLSLMRKPIQLEDILDQRTKARIKRNQAASADFSGSI